MFIFNNPDVVGIEPQESTLTPVEDLDEDILQSEEGAEGESTEKSKLRDVEQHPDSPVLMVEQLVRLLFLATVSQNDVEDKRSKCSLYPF